MASRTAELFVRVLMDTKDVDSGLGSLSDSLRRIGEFAIGNILAKGFDNLTESLGNAVSTAIDATGSWERLQMTLSNMTANEIYMNAVTKQAVSEGMQLVTVTKDGTTTLKDNTLALQKQANALENSRMSLQNAEMNLAKFQATAKGKAGEGEQFVILKNNVEKAKNSLENAELSYKKLQDTSIRTEFVEVFKTVTAHTKSWNEALNEASPRVKEMLQWVTKLGVESPFTEESVTKTLQNAMSYGFASEKAQALTQALLDYGAASGKSSSNLELLSIAFGQIHARGKVLGQELRQLVNNGLDLNLVAGAMNMTMSELTKEQLAGTLSAEGLIDAFIALSNERFAGQAKELAFTWAGLVPTLKDISRISLRDIFYEPLRAIEPALGGIINIWQSMRPALQGVGKSMTGTFKAGSDAVTKFLDAIFPVPPVIDKASQKLGKMTGEWDDTANKLPNFQKRLSNALKTLGLTDKTANSMSEGLLKLKDSIEKGAAKAFQFFSEKVLPAVTSAITFLFDNWETLMAAFQGIGTLLIAAGAFQTILGILSLITNPITILTGAAAALGIAWNNNWLGMRDKLGEVWTTIKGIFDAITGWFNNTGSVTSFGDTWNNTWNNLKTTVDDKWKGISDILAGIRQWFQTDFPSTINGLIPIVSSVFAQIKGILTEIASDIAGLFNFKFTGPKTPTSLPGQKFSAKPEPENPYAKLANAPGANSLDVTLGIRKSFEDLEKFLRVDLTNALTNFRAKWEEAWPKIQSAATTAINTIKRDFESIMKWFQDHESDLSRFGLAFDNLGKAITPILNASGGTGQSLLVQFLDWLAREGPLAIQGLADFLNKNGPQISKALGDISTAVSNPETWKQFGTTLAGVGATLAGIKLVDFFVDIGMWLGRAEAWMGSWLPFILTLGASVPIIATVGAAWAFNLGGIRDKISGVIPDIANMTDSVKGLTAALLALAAAFAAGAIAQNLGAIGSAISGGIGGIRLGKLTDVQAKAIAKRKIAPDLLSEWDMAVLATLPPTLGQKNRRFRSKMAQAGEAFGDLSMGVRGALQPTRTEAVGMLPGVGVEWLTQRKAALQALPPSPGVAGELAHVEEAIGKGGTMPKIIEQTVPKGFTGMWAELKLAVKGFGAEIVSVFPGLRTLGLLLQGIASPIGWVIGALTLLGIAYATNLFGFRDAVNNVVGVVVAKFNELWATIQPIIQPFVDALKQIWDILMGAAASTILTSWDNLKTTFSNLNPVIQSLKASWENLKVALGNAWTAIQPIVELLGRVLGPVVGIAIGLIAGLAVVIGGVLVVALAAAASVVVNAFAAAFNIAVTVVTAAVNELSAIINFVASVVQLVVDAVSAIFTGDWSKVWADAAKVWETFKTLLETTLNSAWQILVGIFTGIGDFIVNTLKSWGIDWSGKWDEFKKTITNIDLAKAAEDLIAGFIQGFVKKWDEVTDTVDRFAKNIILTVGKALGVASPSTVFEDIGKNLIQGLINGITGLLGELGKIAGQIKDTILGIFGGNKKEDTKQELSMNLKLPDIKTLQADWESGWAAIQASAKNAFVAIETIFTGIQDWGKLIPATILGLQNIWVNAWSTITVTFMGAWASMLSILMQMNLWIGTNLVFALTLYEAKSNIMWPATSAMIIAVTSPVLGRLIELALKIEAVRLALYGLRNLDIRFDLGPFNGLISKLHEVAEAARQAAEAIGGMGGSAGPGPNPNPGQGAGTGSGPAPTPPSTSPVPGGGGNCFVGRTEVSTPGGPCPIRDLRVGDQVLTWDSTQDMVAVTHVTALFIASRNDLVRVRTKQGCEFHCSPNHRFLTTRGWVEANCLVGYDLVSVGAPDPVLLVGKLAGWYTVYNFEVAHEAHTYLVAGHVVHNRKYEYAALGKNYTTGSLIVGERGPEILTPPTGSRVVPAYETRKLIRKERAIVINMYPVLNNDLDIETVAYRVADYIARKR